MNLKTISTFILLSAIALVGCMNTDQDDLSHLKKSSGGETTTKGIFSAPEKLECKNLLIDASHDGGVWWFPQDNGCNPNQNHQGEAFSRFLKSKNFRVDVLPKGYRISDEIFQNYQVIIRTGGFGNYTTEEVNSYRNAIDRGITLFLMADHSTHNPNDQIGDLLGIKFSGSHKGEITKFVDHRIFQDVKSLHYLAGSEVTANNENFKPIAWLNNIPVIGEYSHPKSRILISGDVNFIQPVPLPFSDNLAKWLYGDCSGAL
jgi:hypothetical protein